MSEHKYEQYCGLARALDIVGDRWTLLIVRELRPGPRRFTDLVEGLPGISRKLLTERLRNLERDGIITRHELPPPIARQVYALTNDGRDLFKAMTPLITWGAQRLGPPQRSDCLRARWSMMGMAVLADRSAAKGVNETYQYVIGDEGFHFTVDDGTIEMHDGYADDAAVTLTTDAETWADIVAGHLTPSAAVSAGSLTVAGDRRAAKRLGKIFATSHLVGQTRQVGVA
jgi:DNA-binding HxlR family transcriptional regulator/putative sterol carrier protein